MKKIDRRDFLKMAGVGTVVATAAVAVPVGGFFAWTKKDVLRFRAVTGMPKSPFPAYASYVIEGQVNLTSRTGQLAKSIHAGAPDAVSGVVFPGTSRSVRVTDVQQSANTVYIQGVLEDTSTLLRGESPDFKIEIDRASGVAKADFLGSAVVMRVDR